MHHNKLQAVNASNDNLTSGTGTGGNSGNTNTEPHHHHHGLSREASLKKASDGKTWSYLKLKIK